MCSEYFLVRSLLKKVWKNMEKVQFSWMAMAGLGSTGLKTQFLCEFC